MSATTKEENHTQISTKGVQVSGTNEAVTSAGRANELAYQVAKAAKELKRDMETTFYLMLQKLLETQQLQES